MLTNTPLVSCIIPAHNAERYLAEAVQSIMDQTYRYVEIIVVDDGSTDDTAEVAKGLGRGVRYLYQDNAGPSAARNRGLAAARGQLIALLDADDVWVPTKLHAQLSAFRARPYLSAVFTQVQNFWIDPLQAEARRFRDHRIARPIPGYVASTMMATRAVFHLVGPFDPRCQHGEVTDWILRAREHGCSTALLPAPLTRRRLHYDNRSRMMHDQSRDSFLRLVKSHLDKQRTR